MEEKQKEETVDVNGVLGEAEDWILSQHVLVREFQEYQIEQVMDLLQAISNECDVKFILSNTMSNPLTIKNGDGTLNVDLDIRHVVFDLMRHYEMVLRTQCNFTIKPDVIEEGEKDLFKCECGRDMFSHLGTFLRCSYCKREYKLDYLNKACGGDVVEKPKNTDTTATGSIFGRCEHW